MRNITGKAHPVSKDHPWRHNMCTHSSISKEDIDYIEYRRSQYDWVRRDCHKKAGPKYHKKCQILQKIA